MPLMARGSRRRDLSPHAGDALFLLPRSQRGHGRGSYRTLCCVALLLSGVALFAIGKLGMAGRLALSPVSQAQEDLRHNFSAASASQAAAQSSSSAATNAVTQHSSTGAAAGQPKQPCACGSPTGSQLELLQVPLQLIHVGGETLARTYNTTGPNSRYYDIGSWRHTKPNDGQKILFQQDGGLVGDMCFFVRSENGALMLGGSRWMLLGAPLPDNATDMAASGEAGRRYLLSLMEEARDLGLNTLRVLAFKDGHTLPHAMQVAPGIMDEWVMRDGLDWIVWQAGRHSLRVVLVLTSASQEVAEQRGGAAAYIRWFDKQGTISDFFRNDTYKARFFDYMTALATRENHFTKVQYRRDPTLLAWDLGHGLMDPGHKSGDDMQGWLPYMSNFLRGKDPNHLVFLGSEGLFGPASPHHLGTNPSIQARHPWFGRGVPTSATLPPSLPSSAQCEGVDFFRNSMPRELDVAVMSVLPDQWLSCDDECKMKWARDWLAAHVRDALRLQKPLLVGQVSMGGLPTRQLALQRMVVEYLVTASRQGLPIAGVFLSLPSASWCHHHGVEYLPRWNASRCALYHAATHHPAPKSNQTGAANSWATTDGTTPTSTRAPPTTHQQQVSVLVQPTGTTGSSTLVASRPTPLLSTVQQALADGGVSASQRDKADSSNAIVTVLNQAIRGQQGVGMPSASAVHGTDSGRRQLRTGSTAGGGGQADSGAGPGSGPSSQGAGDKDSAAHVGPQGQAGAGLSGRRWLDRTRTVWPWAWLKWRTATVPSGAGSSAQAGAMAAQQQPKAESQQQAVTGATAAGTAGATSDIGGSSGGRQQPGEQRLCDCAAEGPQGLQTLAAVGQVTSGLSQSQLQAVAQAHQRAWLDADWYRFMRGDELLTCLQRQVTQQAQKHAKSLEVKSAQQQVAAGMQQGRKNTTSGDNGVSVVDQILNEDLMRMKEDVQALARSVPPTRR